MQSPSPYPQFRISCPPACSVTLCSYVSAASMSLPGSYCWHAPPPLDCKPFEKFVCPTTESSGDKYLQMNARSRLKSNLEKSCSLCGLKDADTLLKNIPIPLQELVLELCVAL